MTYLDTRDLAKRLDELEEMNDDYETTCDLPAEDPNRAEPLDEDEAIELAELRELRDEVTEWQYGATLIPTDEFEDYARELADDIGAVPREYGWPTSHIDWSAAADALAQDYSEVTYQGSTYYVRD